MKQKRKKKSLLSASEKRIFIKHLLNDIKAFEILLKENFFENDVIRIGAEQELALVGNDWKPAMHWDKILSSVNDSHVNTELAQFNIEINLDPQVFENDCIDKMAVQLRHLLAKVRKAGKDIDTKIILTGILPTITKSELEFEFMTPNPRYKMLNDIIRSQKGEDFEIIIRGIDELATRHSSILFEACNTSFQVHLQIKEKEFVEKYNWAQLISAPVLAAAANSSLLMGRRLWHENRIAVFEQSIDLRNRMVLHRDIQQRVSFGRDWLKNSVVDIFKDNISRFKLLLTTEIMNDSVEEIRKGITPSLDALRLHNGTVYSWNRACYGISDTDLPHLRIENRYMPSGPTIQDEIANAAFWFGLMEGMPEEYKNFEKRINFGETRYNFYQAAQASLHTNTRWFGKEYSMQKLILDVLLPIAENGLKNKKILNYDEYLDIVRKRVRKMTNGAIWTEKNFTILSHNSTLYEAAKNITQLMYENELDGKCIHEWKDINQKNKYTKKKFETAEQIMITDIPTVLEEDTFELVLNIMEWREVRYVAVENFQHELVGLVTGRRVIKEAKDNLNINKIVKDIMVTNLITVSQDTPLAEIIRLMVKNNIGCLPVVSVENKLLGIITERVILTVSHMRNIFGP